MGAKRHATGKKTVLVVDDQDEMRVLVREILASDPELLVVGEARDGLSALTLVAGLSPDLVLMDMEMPVLDGLTAASRILARFPATTVVLMSAYHEQEYKTAALRSGASDFIPKVDLTTKRLKQALASTSEARTPKG